MPQTLIESLVPPDGAPWSDAAWCEVEAALMVACARHELIWLADTAGPYVPLPEGGGEISKANATALLRELPPEHLAERYRALLAKRRSDGPRRFPTERAA